MGADFEKPKPDFNDKSFSLTSSSSDDEMTMVEFLFPFPIESQFQECDLGKRCEQKITKGNFRTLGRAWRGFKKK